MVILMIRHKFVLPALLAASLSCVIPLSAEDKPVPVPLVNADFKQSKEGLPDGWKPSPGSSGASSSITVDPAGGVKMTDNDEGNGLGLAQWVDVNPGDKYTATAEVSGTGNLAMYLIFVPSIPPKEAMVGKVKLSEVSVSMPPKTGSAAEVSAVAPAGATKMRIWLYCPKIGKCDVLIKSVSLNKTGSGPAPTAALKSVPDGTPNKERNDHGRDNPDSMIKPGTVATVDFETGDFSQTRTLEGGKKEVISAPEPVRSGQHAMKVMLTHDQHRTEMTSFRSAPYGEFKYGWSIYLPKEFDGNSWFSIVTQWHSWGSGKDYTITPPGPPTCMVISKDKWDFLLRYQDGDTDKATQKHFDLGSIDPDRGKWTDFYMEVNWQSPKSGGGYVRLWKDGQQVVDYQGPTWFEDKTSGPFFKMGVYKGAGTWKGEESGAVLYFDEFRMGDKTVSREAVDPTKQSAPAAVTSK